MVKNRRECVTTGTLRNTAKYGDGNETVSKVCCNGSLARTTRILLPRGMRPAHVQSPTVLPTKSCATDNFSHAESWGWCRHSTEVFKRCPLLGGGRRPRPGRDATGYDVSTSESYSRLYPKERGGGANAVEECLPVIESAQTNDCQEEEPVLRKPGQCELANFRNSIGEKQ